MIRDISFYNPTKTYHNTDHIKYLYELLPYANKKVCFYGDETGYFFSPFRRKYKPNICFTNRLFATLFTLIKEDINYLKSLFAGYSEAFDVALIPHFENTVYTVNNPYKIAYYTFVLSLYSNNIDDKFSNYNTNDSSLLKEAVSNMTKYSISNNEVFWEVTPDNNFIVSYEKDFNGEGILISKKKHDLNHLKTIDKLNYYYKQGGKHESR